MGRSPAPRGAHPALLTALPHLLPRGRHRRHAHLWPSYSFDFHAKLFWITFVSLADALLVSSLLLILWNKCVWDSLKLVPTCSPFSWVHFPGQLGGLVSALVLLLRSDIEWEEQGLCFLKTWSLSSAEWQHVFSGAIGSQGWRLQNYLCVIHLIREAISTRELACTSFCLSHCSVLRRFWNSLAYVFTHNMTARAWSIRPGWKSCCLLVRTQKPHRFEL